MFAARVQERTLKLGTRLCLGLDPRVDAYRDVAHLREHTLQVLEACGEFAACAKPQLAFYEALGADGIRVLEHVCNAARELGLPVLLDAKRGDIGSTAEAYARAWLSGPHAGDAMTVSPYLGWETLGPFVSMARRNGGGIFVLVKTSNPGSRDLQDDGAAEKVANEVRRLGDEEASSLASAGAVVGATHPRELAHWRERMPKATLLLPGLGAHGGRPEDLAPAFLQDGTGAIASASRGIQYAEGLSVDASRASARAFRDALNRALGR